MKKHYIIVLLYYNYYRSHFGSSILRSLIFCFLAIPFSLTELEMDIATAQQMVRLALTQGVSRKEMVPFSTPSFLKTAYSIVMKISEIVGTVADIEADAKTSIKARTLFVLSGSPGADRAAVPSSDCFLYVMQNVERVTKREGYFKRSFATLERWLRCAAPASWH